MEVSSDNWVCVKGRFVSFSSLSPFGGSGAYRINDSPQFSPLKVASKRFLLHFLRHSPLVHSSFLSIFRRYTPPLKVASDSWVCVKGDV
ncbi:hypothetical protein HMPREF9072_01519, partial [Capnocytophaga sp. oral taxon 324 str. F0483]